MKVSTISSLVIVPTSFSLILLIPSLIAFLILAVLSGFSDFAAASEIDYSANLFDSLHYRSAAGSFYTSVNAATRLYEHEVQSQDGISTSDDDRSSWTSAVTFNYGISDLFQIGISETYLFGLSTRHTNDQNGNVTNSRAAGFSNPTFTFNYRYWGTLSGTNFANLYVNFSPTLGSHQDATATTTGNNLDGASAVTMGTNIYGVQGAHEWAIEPQITYTSNGTNIDSAKETNTNSVDPRWSYNLAGVYRYHFHEKLYLTATATLNGPTTQNSTYFNRNPVTSTSTTTNPYVSAAVAIGFVMSPSALLSLQYSINNRSQNINPSAATASSTSIQQQLMTVTAAFSY
ncbi:MAG: hypothetical protein C5B49_11315 [Bdellovibrio sp.]|nr:MAG: hypothetical protein C5B49_11315 [Bdellovibrio sp.]